VPSTAASCGGHSPSVISPRRVLNPSSAAAMSVPQLQMATMYNANNAPQPLTAASKLQSMLQVFTRIYSSLMEPHHNPAHYYRKLTCFDKRATRPKHRPSMPNSLNTSISSSNSRSSCSVCLLLSHCAHYSTQLLNFRATSSCHASSTPSRSWFSTAKLCLTTSLPSVVEQFERHWPPRQWDRTSLTTSRSCQWYGIPYPAWPFAFPRAVHRGTSLGPACTNFCLQIPLSRSSLIGRRCQCDISCLR
jgi:hypothetical protein